MIYTNAQRHFRDVQISLNIVPRHDLHKNVEGFQLCESGSGFALKF